MTAPTRHRILKDRRTKNLIRRLHSGDIAVIHHADLDTTAARALIEAQVKAVFNTVASVSGRYPNRGPSLLLEAGIPLIDACGEEAFERITEGSFALFDETFLKWEDGFCVTGKPVTEESLAVQLSTAQNNLNYELDLFARNTLEYLNQEQSLLFDPLEIPPLKTSFANRHVLIVVRGESYKEDLAMLRDYLSDVRPVLLAVDGGADALLEAKLRPDVILGDMDSITDAALRCGAELIVHGYSKGDVRGAPGLSRVEALGLKAQVFHSPGTSEDVAMLLADELGAQLIVAVGTHFSLVDFLDKGRKGMASTFLTRLRIGSKLVDAKGIARLWSRSRIRFREIALLMGAAATPIIAVMFLSPMGRNLLQTLRVWFRLHF
ncbi:thiamin pyrophosphokinase [Armatimonadota bacterium]|nr:thiamin pyrophosphokinase [Armatimonadota bacterium]